ncbi:MAG: YicC/YloC family endoribonuclease [Candidatus Berkiellales bacterium]
MIASMTAFARSMRQHDWGQAIWEIRSVNHRYLDLSFKLPDPFREWESEWRNLATKMLQRGKVECYLNFFPSHQTTPALKINVNLVEALLANCQTIMQYPNVSPTLKAMDILSWPQVLISENQTMTSLKEPLTTLFDATMQDLIATRQREGSQIQGLMQSKLQQVLAQVDIAKERFPHCIEQQRQKLQQKVKDIQVTVDPQRLEQEVVLYAQRIDVEEEIKRLETHVKEVNRTLTGGGPAGRRLDFLMQEMGREANTLAAKAADPAITQAAIELKVLIEQMREQIQNVE